MGWALPIPPPVRGWVGGPLTPVELCRAVFVAYSGGYKSAAGARGGGGMRPRLAAREAPSATAESRGSTSRKLARGGGAAALPVSTGVAPVPQRGAAPTRNASSACAPCGTPTPARSAPDADEVGGPLATPAMAAAAAAAFSARSISNSHSAIARASVCGLR